MDTKIIFNFLDPNAVYEKIYHYNHKPSYIVDIWSRRNNTFHGEQSRFHPNGQVSFKGWIVDGYEQGPFYEYNDKGILIILNNYLDGNMDGWQLYFNDDGSFRRQELWKEGVCIEGCE
jgi:antitoxin component YwqK of YwqJK toxin-antitoxin module